MKHRRSLVLSLLIPALLLGGCGLWLRQAKRQYALDRELIAALVANDTKQAVALVKAGSDPNTRYIPSPAPSFTFLLDQLLHRSSASMNVSSTAFMIACGAIWQSDAETFYEQEGRPDNIALVEALFQHGAEAQAQAADGDTALMDAVIMERTATVAFLLEHGAKAEAVDKYGWSPLMRAVTYYHDPRIIRLLLAQGADPYRSNQQGFTAISLAQREKRPSIVRMLQRAEKTHPHER